MAVVRGQNCNTYEYGTAPSFKQEDRHDTFRSTSKIGYWQADLKTVNAVAYTKSKYPVYHKRSGEIPIVCSSDSITPSTKITTDSNNGINTICNSYNKKPTAANRDKDKRPVVEGLHLIQSNCHIHTGINTTFKQFSVGDNIIDIKDVEELYNTSIDILNKFSTQLELGTNFERNLSQNTLVKADIFKEINEKFNKLFKLTDNTAENIDNNFETGKIIQRSTFDSLIQNINKYYSDCLCYTDCISYSICFCYGNCSYY